MTHTYFSAGRQWQASGLYYDENGVSYELSGLACLSRGDGGWTLNGHIEVKFDEPVRFYNTYQIHETGSPITYRWTSFNPALGELKGTFNIIGNNIISVYTSENSEYSGTETLIQVDDNTYHNVGVSFHNDCRMSAWTAVLASKPR